MNHVGYGSMDFGIEALGAIPNSDLADKQKMVELFYEDAAAITLNQNMDQFKAAYGQYKDAFINVQRMIQEELHTDNLVLLQWCQSTKGVKGVEFIVTDEYWDNEPYMIDLDESSLDLEYLLDSYVNVMYTNDYLVSTMENWEAK